MIVVILGLVGWLIFLLIKFNALDLAVKRLTQEQLKLQQQLAQLQKRMGKENPSPEQTKPPLVQVIDAQLGHLAEREQNELNSVHAEDITPRPQTTPAPPVAPASTAPSTVTTPTPAPSQNRPTTPINRPVSPPPPSQPSLLDNMVLAVRNFFTQGNPIVRIGMVIMFFGVSFLVKYASGQGLLPIELRLSAVILVAVALLVFGWRTRLRPGGYGLVLQGGGIAIIYLTLFAAAKMYQLMPLSLAFALLFVVVVFGVLLAVLQNAQVLAILATAGGFLAPILTSSGSGSHVGLFSFYLILNLGILGIAVYKSWRLLNWVGFIFTFVITALWGVLKYEPALYASTQPFLLAFFALYLTLAVLFSFKQPANLKGLVDGSLVFGLPLVAFGLQTKLLMHTEYGLAISAAGLAAIYLALCYLLAKRHLATQRVLIEAFLALGVSFATLAVPLALDASWTSVTWALEATGLVWLGFRQARLRGRIVGYLLHAAAAFSLVAGHGVKAGPTPLLSGDYLGLVLLAITSFAIAYIVHSFAAGPRLPFERFVGAFAIAAGVLWWCVAGISELAAHTNKDLHFAAILVFSALSAAMLMQLSAKLKWPNIALANFALIPYLILLSIIYAGNSNEIHPAHSFGLAALALAAAINYWFLYKQEQLPDAANIVRVATGPWHVLTAWWLIGLIFWEAAWQSHQHELSGTARIMLWFAAVIIPAGAIIGAGAQKFWPFNRLGLIYKSWVPAPLFLAAGGWFVGACFKTARAGDWYLPLLNPLDLAQFAIIIMFVYAVRRGFLASFSQLSQYKGFGLLFFAVFVWFNVVTLRAVSHYQHIDYQADVLWNSMAVQMALSILWSLCALLVMNLARRFALRQVWMVGAGLLALVVLKLATKDLAGSGTLAGIISFMVVGALMLLIGYLSPIPAKKIQPLETSTQKSAKDANPSEQDSANG